MAEVKQKVLVADDHPINRKFLVSLLEDTGFDALEASDGAEALELARKEQPDLIIADVVMPKVDGYELVKEVRSDPTIAQTPVIFYTANYIETEARRLAEACGVRHLLIKPSKAEDILNHVRTALQAPAPESMPAVPPEFDREHCLILTNKLCEKVDELESLNLTLESRLKEIAQAEEAAQSANRAKDQFIAALSHELRTPLTPVLALVSYLVKHTSTLPPELRNEIEMIRRNVELEARLIDDLLDVTRISAGKLELALEVTDAHAAVRGALDICAEDIRTKKLTPELDLQASEYWIRADPVRLHQAFWNILNNAVKFTPSGGRITIRSRNDATGDFILAVEDSGIGFEPEIFKRMFAAFEQGNRSITREFGGLGLGLTITKNLVEAHHGRLEAFSGGRNAGATFKIALKTVSAEASPAATHRARVDHAARLRILVVDDHDDTRRVIGNLLRIKGHEVFTASSVSSALEVLAHEAIDLLLSDIGLPDGTGYELMERAKALQPLTGVAFSGFGMIEDIARALDCGFAYHMVKPLNIEQLESVLRHVTPKDVFKGTTTKMLGARAHPAVSNLHGNLGPDPAS